MKRKVLAALLAAAMAGTLLAGLFAAYDKRKAGKRANKKQAAENVA